LYLQVTNAVLKYIISANNIRITHIPIMCNTAVSINILLSQHWTCDEVLYIYFICRRYYSTLLLYDSSKI
jgi:hypothetical protein